MKRLHIRSTLKQAKVSNPSTSIRYNSSFLYEDEQVTVRKNDIKKRLTGKPFDNLESFKVADNDFISNIDRFNPDYITSPFVHLDETVALNVIFNDYFNNYLSKYDYYSRPKHDNSSKYQDKLSIILNWKKNYEKSYKQIPSNTRTSDLILTNEIKTEILNTISDESTFEFDSAIAYLSEKFPKLSKSTILSLYVKTIPDFSKSEQNLFIEQLTENIINNILHYHDQVLQSILFDLIETQKIQAVTSIIRAYNQFTHGDFLSVVPESFLEVYLKGIIDIKDVSTAKEIFDVLEYQGVMPNINIITSYFELTHNISKNADTSDPKKEMLFNLLTKPLSGMILQKGSLNEEIINHLSAFVRLHTLPLFIKYLKQSIHYKELKSIPDIIINRIASSATFMKKSDQDKAIFLTTIIKLLDFEYTELSESAKKTIVALYANSHSPLAVLLWSQRLESPISKDEKETILRVLQNVEESDNVSSKIDISDKL